MTPLWFCYHVPKTGGQTLRDHLASELRREIDYLHLGKWDRAAALESADVEALDPAQRADIRVLSGHPLTREMAALFPGREVREVAVLREPARRLVSLYNFRMTMTTRRGQPTYGFEEFLEEIPSNQMTSLLAKCLGLKGRGDILGAVLYELSRLWFVGRTETLDATLPLVLSAMGLPARQPERSNVTGVDIDQWMTLTPDLAEDLHRDNGLDVALYAAVTRFEQNSVERLSLSAQSQTGHAIGSDPI